LEASTRRARHLGRDLIELAREVARGTSNYYGLYWYLWQRGGASVRELWRAYCGIAGRAVRFATVRKQLRILEDRYRAIRHEGEYYYPLVDPEVLVSVVNVARARAGKLGAQKRAMLAAMGLGRERLEELRVPTNLRYYVGRVVEEAKRLVEKGDRAGALDLVVHTLLPLRENEVLWLWRKDEFTYWDNKTHTFRCVRSEAVADFLRNLGYTEGIMCWHVLGHGRASRVIRSLFGRGWESWAWARSISYGLMLLGLVGEGSAYQIELWYRDGVLDLVLRDYYYGTTLAVYDLRWEHGEPPAPLSGTSSTYRGAVVGAPHSKPENAESYFSRWR